jgi:recombination protein RecT
MATQPNTAIVQRKDVRSLLSSDAFLAQVESAVPEHMKATVLLRVATTTIQKTPALLECSRESLLGAVIECAQLGLVPDGILGQAYLVPYKQKAQLQIGYRGLIELARRSGQVAYVAAEAVYHCDEFSINFAPERTMKHIPDLENEQRGEMGNGIDGKKFIPEGLRGVYAQVKYKDGETDFEYLPLHKIEQIRNKAQAGNKPDAPWMNHWVEMARKSAIRALAKRLPLSAEFMNAANLDDLNEQGINTGDARAILGDAVMANVAQDKAAELAGKYSQKPAPEIIMAETTPNLQSEGAPDDDLPIEAYGLSENPSQPPTTSSAPAEPLQGGVFRPFADESTTQAAPRTNRRGH